MCPFHSTRLLLVVLSCLSLSASSSPPPFSSLSFFSRPPPYSFLPLSAPDNPYLSRLSNATYDHQSLDHFGWSLTTQRWSQRYLYSTERWLPPSAPNGPGPIFLYAGNEGPIETFASNSGWMFELAESFNAMLVFVEHRFYGRSMPWEGNATLSYTNVSTLNLLTSEQAIADYVQFVEWMRGGGHETESGPFAQCRGNCTNIPVIVFGGSYGGMLAAWMRMKYPASVAGAIAASAPIWQFTGLTSPDVYNSIITRVYSSDAAQCSGAIKRSWTIISNYSTTAAGLATLTSIFRPCATNTTFTNHTAHSLYDFLYSAISYMAMANYPYEADFLGPMPASPVSYVCRTYFRPINITDDVAVLRAMAALANVFYNYTGQAGGCFDIVNGSHGPSTLGNGLQGWSWQSCTEMVMPVGQYEATDMFWADKWDLSAVKERCHAQYGVEPNEGYIIRHYGGVHIESASRILFSNGALDPWSGGGVNDTALGGEYSTSNTRGVVALMMDNAAHHLDLRGSNATYDPQSVQWVRQQQKLYIQAWIDGYDTPAEENATAGLDTKWVVLISVGATLVVILVAACLFHFCRSDEKEEEDDSSHGARHDNYATMQG